MKKFYIKFRIALMTFTIGLASVWFSDNFQWTEKFYELNQTDIENALILNKNNLTMFVLTGHGCGNGYVNGYETQTGEKLSEGVGEISKKEFNKLLHDSEIIELTDNAKNRYGESGKRVVLKESGDSGKVNFSINWYRKGEIVYINAPTLELAHKLENWLIENERKRNVQIESQNKVN